MRDQIIAAIRTAVQTYVTAGGVAIAAWLADFDIEVGQGVIDSAGLAIGGLVAAIAVGAVTLALNKLQEKFPWIGSIISLGSSKETPTY